MILLPWIVVMNAAPFASAPGVGVIGAGLTGFQTSGFEDSEVSIVENGGFEEGLQGWQVTNIFLASSGSSYPSISTSSIHSGSAGAALNFLSSSSGGSTAQSMELTGIYQTVNVRRLTGLHVGGWFSMRQTVSSVAARMRVQVGSLGLSYYVAYDSEQRLRYYDTAGSRSVFVYQVGPGQNGWWELDRDVEQDFELLFGSEGQGVFQQDQTTVTIALELMGFGFIPTYQVMLWDDIEALARVGMNSTTTTMASVSTTTTSSSIQSTMSTSTSSYSSTTSSTPTEGALLGAIPWMQASVAVAVALTLVTCFFLAGRSMRKRTHTGITCTHCGASDLRTDSIYCPECGTKRNRPSGQEVSEPKKTAPSPGEHGTKD